MAITKFIGDTIYVTVTIRNTGTLSGTAYARVSLVPSGATTGIDLINADTETLDGVVPLVVGQTTIAFFAANIPAGTEFGLYNTVCIVRSGPNLTGDVLDELTESSQVQILPPPTAEFTTTDNTYNSGFISFNNSVYRFYTRTNTSNSPDGAAFIRVTTTPEGFPVVIDKLSGYIYIFLFFDGSSWHISVYQLIFEPPPPEVLPPDVDNLSGLSHNVSMGLLEPRATLGDAGPAWRGEFISTREFTIEEITGEFESIAMRIYFPGPFTNNSPINFRWDTFMPNGSMAGGLPVTVSIPTPQSQGGEWWSWYAIGLVMAGPPREIYKKGIYRTVVTVTSGPLVSGSFTWYWEVI